MSRKAKRLSEHVSKQELNSLDHKSHTHTNNTYMHIDHRPITESIKIETNKKETEF